LEDLIMQERKPLKKITDDEWIGGVCGGIAYAYGLPVTVIRIIFVIFVLILTNPLADYIGQIFFLFYLLFWFLGPRWEVDPEDYTRRTM
jgi:phage shock protein PspC (stress-responsive transcriptional regulator)